MPLGEFRKHHVKHRNESMAFNLCLIITAVNRYNIGSDYAEIK